MSFLFVIFGFVCGGVIGTILGRVADDLVEDRLQDWSGDGAVWGACLGGVASFTGFVNLGTGGALIGGLAAAPALAIAIVTFRLFSWCWWECFRAFVEAVDALAARISRAVTSRRRQ